MKSCASRIASRPEGGGPAAWAGLRAEDVIVTADGFQTSTNESLRRVTATSNGVVRQKVARQGVHQNVRRVVVDMRPKPIAAPQSGASAPAPGAPAPR